MQQTTEAARHNFWPQISLPSATRLLSIVYNLAVLTFVQKTTFILLIEMLFHSVKTRVMKDVAAVGYIKVKQRCFN